MIRIGDYIKSGFELFSSPQLTWGQRWTLVSYLFRTRLLGKPIIRSVEIMHTLRCNCRCAFCSNENLSEGDPVMQKEDVFGVIDKLAEHGVTAIIFLGGESMTDPHFVDYVRYTRKKNIVPLLQTNGTLLTKERIKDLSEAGLFSVTITIHDVIPEEHDAVVNRSGSLETILNALPLLRQYNIKVVFKTLYSKDSVSSGAFGRILQLAREEGVLLNVNPMMPVGRGIGEENLLSDDDRHHYLQATLSDSVITTHTKTEYDHQCPAGHLYLGILPDGEILPCYFLPLSVGNIRNTDILTAQRRAADLGIFRKGVDSCIVAMNEAFYREVILELYSGKYALPIRIQETPSIKNLITGFTERHLKG